MGCYDPKERGDTIHLIRDTLGGLRILIVLFEIYRLVRQKWQHCLLKKPVARCGPRKMINKYPEPVEGYGTASEPSYQIRRRRKYVRISQRSCG